MTINLKRITIFASRMSKKDLKALIERLENTRKHTEKSRVILLMLHNAYNEMLWKENNQKNNQAVGEP